MAGKIQNEDIKSSAELISAGATAASLPNDDKVWVKANTINKTLNQAITDGDIGGGSGGINYIPFQVSKGATLTGTQTYADAAGTAPVDGTGGSPASTLAVSTNSSLISTTNFLWTKSAANRQGEGWSVDFSIDQGYQSKPFTISALYRIASGTYADGDMTVWIYDVTNSQVIQPSSYLILNNTGAGEIKCEFQTNSNSTSYRLIFHTSSTSALAYTLRFDSISVSPNTYNRGSTVTDWQTTPAPSGTITNATRNTWFARRVGGNIEVQCTVLFNGAGVLNPVCTASALLPPGLLVDTSRLSVGADTPFYANVGEAYSLNTGVASYNNHVQYAQATDSFYVVNENNGAPFVPGNLDSVQLTFSVPILGWGTSQVLSSDTDTREVSCIYSTTAAATSDSSTPIRWTVKVIDTHGIYDTATGRCTPTVPGRYVVNPIAGTTTTGGWGVYKNGSFYAYLPTMDSAGNDFSGSVAIDIKVGDYFDVRCNSSRTVSSFAQYLISIYRLSGPAQIAASEKITALYMVNVAATTNTTLPVQWSDKIIDTHGAVTTGSAWKFTAPRADTYMINGTMDVGTTANVYVYKNGVIYQSAGIIFSNTGVIVASVPLLAGEYLDIRADSSTVGSSIYKFISITSRG